MKIKKKLGKISQPPNQPSSSLAAQSVFRYRSKLHSLNATDATIPPTTDSFLLGATAQAKLITQKPKS